MLRLQTKKKKNGSKRFLGAYVPLNLSQYLYMYCLANEKSVSAIFEGILDAWFFKNKSTSIETLAIKVTARAIKVSKNYTTKQKNEFLKGLEKQLTGKQIEQTLIDGILENVKKSYIPKI